MPSIASYTPYESLLFFQSIVQHGSSHAALQEISDTLKANDFIREDATFDQDRFTVTALKDFYDAQTNEARTLRREATNGDNEEAEVNPRKRKFSPPSPPPPSTDDRNEELLEALVEELYAKFKTQVLDEILRDEQEFDAIQQDIDNLQAQIDTESAAHDDGQKDHVTSNSEISATTATAASSQRQSPISSRPSGERPAILPSIEAPAAVEALPTLAGVADRVIGQPPSAEPTPHVAQQFSSPRASTESAPVPYPQQRPPYHPSQPPMPSPYADAPFERLSPTAFQNRTLPPPSPQRPNYGPISSAPNLPHGLPHAINVPPYGLPMTNVVPHGDGSHHRRVSSGQGRGSPIPYQQPHPSYVHFPGPQGPWSPPRHPHGPQHPHPAYPHPQYYPQHPLGPNQPFHGPPPITYSPYPPLAHVEHHSRTPSSRPMPTATSWDEASRPSASTPANQGLGHQSEARVPGSSTPWKSKFPPPRVPKLPSPERPEREISPLTDGESPGPFSPSIKADSVRAQEKDRSRQRGRPKQSATPVLHSSRSASRVSDVAASSELPGISSKTRRAHIKAEPLNTPGPLLEDVDSHRSSTRRGRVAGNNLEAGDEVLGPENTSKRKRSPEAEMTSPSARLDKIVRTMRRRVYSTGPHQVVISKKFAKTAQPLLAEILSHRLASFFAKPVTERDAPGYKQLILTPQNLTAIKLAVSKGKQAASAAIEEQEQIDETNASILVSSLNAAGIRVVEKTSDLVPPKAIVNSTQLEKELMRTFANAIMFNPLPSSERGYGASLHLSRHASTTSVTSPDSDMDSTQSDDTRIILDARQIFEDVAKSLENFKNLEDERLESLLSLSSVRADGRAASVSMSSVIGDEGLEDTPGDEGLEDTPGERAGNRKRRKITDIDHGG